MAAVGQQAYDISGYKSPMFFAIGGYELSKKIHTKLYYRTKFVGGKQRTIPFPQSTKGVLYYHQPPDDPEGRGQIRFRLCDDVAQFLEGRDLELPNGTPWVWNVRSNFLGSDVAANGLLQLLSEEWAPDPSVAPLHVGEMFATRPLLTLIPGKMLIAGQKIFNLSGITRAHFRISKDEHALPELGKGSRSYYPLNLIYKSEHGGLRTIVHQFPPNTKGFLYYHIEPGQPAISGQLRFRKCDNLSSFNSGDDLDLGLGKPWSVSLCQIAAYDQYIGLRHLLCREGLVDEALVSDIQKLPVRLELSLYSINQPFFIDLSKGNYRLHLITRHSSEIFKLNHLFRDNRSCYKTPIKPYAGRVMVRLELSTLPEHAKYGPTLVLRYLRFLTPVECTVPGYDHRVTIPQVGNLYSFNRGGKGNVPWAYQLNKRTYGPVVKSFLELSKTTYT